jgi:hypothetical protein
MPAVARQLAFGYGTGYDAEFDVEFGFDEIVWHGELPLKLKQPRTLLADYPLKHSIQTLPGPYCPTS